MSKREKLRILHIAPIDFSQLQSGLTYSIPKLVQYQNRIQGCSTCLLNIHSVASAPESLQVPKFHFRGIKDSKIVGLPEEFQRPSLAVFHSTYIPAYAALGTYLRQKDIPYVITPHGGMTRYAQSLSRMKKLLGNILFFDRLVRGSKAIHCLSEGEAEQIVRWQHKRFVVGNGIDLPPSEDTAKPGHGSDIVLTYIGRTDYLNKGLDLLIAGVAQTADELRNGRVSVKIYGPDDKRGGYRKLRQEIAAARVEDIVQIHPAIWSSDKARVLKRSDVFVLLSRSEGHPMGLLEALAYGIPALVTPGSRMAEEIAAAGAGWTATDSVGSVAFALRQILASKGRLAGMGQQARRLVESRYTWEKVAAQTIEHYHELIQGHQLKVQ